MRAMVACSTVLLRASTAHRQLVDPATRSDDLHLGRPARFTIVAPRCLCSAAIMRWRPKMRKAAIWVAMMCAAMLPRGDGAHAQRQVAAPVTDPGDPKYLTAQTRKMGGPMPAEQLALIFDHLDLALKVFPNEQRIEGAATLRLRTKAPIKTLILDLFPKFTISEIDIDGRKIAPSAYANPEGQLRIALATPFEAGATFDARVVYAEHRRSPSVRPGKAARPGRRRPTANIRGSIRRCGAAAATCSTRASIIRRSSRRRPTSTTPCPRD